MVYPNPSDGKLFIESKSFLDEDFTLDVYSVLGQKVFSETNIKLESKEIDLSALNSGTYFIKLSNDFRALQQTLVIK